MSKRLDSYQGPKIRSQFQTDFSFVPEGKHEAITVPINGQSLFLASKYAESPPRGSSANAMRAHCDMRDSVTVEAKRILQQHDIKPINFMLRLVAAFKQEDPQLAEKMQALDIFFEDEVAKLPEQDFTQRAKDRRSPGGRCGI